MNNFFPENFLFVFLFLVLFPGKMMQAGDSNYKIQRALNFTEAAEMAVAASVELRNAYAEHAIKEQAWSWGVRQYFPRLGFSVSENDRLQELGADSFVKNYSVNLDQLLWDGGRTSLSRNLRRMELNAEFCRLDRMASQIAVSALAAYRNVLSSRAILSIREAALKTLCEQKRILSDEVTLGLALPLDLAEAELTLAGAEIEIISLHSELDELEQQFAEILGLDILPELTEKVDIRRCVVLPDYNAALVRALERNPDMSEARRAIVKSQGELMYAGRSWIPGFRLQGSFGLNGRTYPLTRYTWSVGLNIELSGPWLQNTLSIQGGREAPYDSTAQLHNNIVPAPNIEAGFSRRQAEQTLALEREKYRLAMERMGRFTRRGMEKCVTADKNRSLSVEAIFLAQERLRLEELRLNLGHITRLDLMEAMIEYEKKEISAVNASISLLEAELEFEGLLDLKPGELALFAVSSGGLTLPMQEYR